MMMMMVPIPGPPNLESNQQAFNHCDSTVGLLASTNNNSLTSCTNTKGLLNMPGQNNCFLNSAIQVLWHLDIFRRTFRELSSHACMAESCIFCALKELFTQFQYSQESALPPDALRHALANSFCDQRRFQLGFMDDAAECFENILLRIHVHIVNKDFEDICNDQNCIPHQKFAMVLVEQAVCYNCKATSEPLLFTQMVHYVTTSALCSKASELKQQGYSTYNCFGGILQHAGNVGEGRKCSSGCGSNVFVNKTLMNFPEIVSLGLVWDSESPSLQKITDVLCCIGMILHIKDMFHAVYEKERTEETCHELVGIVTYYGKHYSTFFFHTKLRKWIYFDDAAVREVGPSWEMVVEKCQKGRFQPLLLLYANKSEKHFSVNGAKVNKGRAFNCPYSEKQEFLQKYAQMQDKFKDSGPYSSLNISLKKHQYNSRCSINAYATDYLVSELNQNFRSSPVCIQSPIYCNSSSSRTPILNYIMNNKKPLNNSSHNGISNHTYHNVTLEHSGSNNLPKVLSANETQKFNGICLKSDPTYHAKCRTTAVIKNDHSDMQHLHIYENTDMQNLHKVKESTDSSKDSDSAFTEDDHEYGTYISRKTVENILHLQKHMNFNQQHVHGGIGNRNSNSSLESFDNIHCIKLNSNQTNKMYRLFPYYSQRCDSGNWSGDCNSSSSSTSVENPLLVIGASKRLFCDLNGSSSKSQCTDSSLVPNSSDHGYDSYSVSSSDSYPSIHSSPMKVEPRLTQIPEDWSTQDFSRDLDKKLKLVTEEGPPDCDKLCAEADLLLAKSHEKEKEGDMVMAALLSDTAAARARAAMDAPYNNSRSLVSAKMKHSTCVMRSSCLYRRLKDEGDERRKSKGHHSRQSSRDSTYSRHSRQGSKDNSCHSKLSSKENSNLLIEDVEHFGKNIEIYGTLPKKGNKKKRCVSPSVPRPKEDQIYKDFLDKQRKNIDSVIINDHKNQKLHDNTKLKSIISSETKHVKKNIELASLRSRKKLDSYTNPIIEIDNSLQKKKNVKHLFDEPKVISQSLGNGNTSDKDIKYSETLDDSNSSDKRQHKIKRKLMGGFMKRKNRSLPDLRTDEFSDDCDQLNESTEGSIVAALTLSNDQSSSNIATITRGFHQPHYAFVKKELKQRPSLVKVSPPNIQSSVLNLSTLKQKHSFSSTLRDPPDEKNQLETKFDSPSRVSPMTNPGRLSFSSDLSMTSVKKPIGVVSPISNLNVHTTAVSSESKISNKELSHKEMTQTKNGLLNSGNPFLAELQAKSKEINNKREIKKSNLQVFEKNDSNSMQVTSSKAGSSQFLKPAEQSGGMSWIKELQSKQKRMQQSSNERNSESTTKACIGIVKECKNGSESVQQMIPNKVHTNVLKKAYVQESNGMEDCKTASSVKNLTSKFESASPKDKMGLNSISCNKTGLLNKYSGVHPSESLGSANSFHQSISATALDDLVKENTPANNFKPENDEIKAAENVNKHTLDLPQRPQQPPDYETAMQRLEHMRSSVIATNTDEEKPISGSPKKRIQKKSVTFSDEVVLVACAEFDDSGFFANPLLERVYQKHLECGGTVLPELRAPVVYAEEDGNLEKNWCIEQNTERDSVTVNSENLTQCNLCHNKPIPKSSVYCVDCTFYMSKYQ